jgi:hypothetical protein
MESKVVIAPFDKLVATYKKNWADSRIGKIAESIGVMVIIL